MLWSHAEYDAETDAHQFQIHIGNFVPDYNFQGVLRVKRDYPYQELRLICCKI